MTLTLDIDLHILQMYLCTENEVFRGQGFQKPEPEEY